ncbi:hypothetical protein N7530_012510 [Penicillium desertorum]|uniref:Uncharacterized protein n=1 Tax=Penicillium desertorum TaxID=1303715 RepID=A0A9W9WFN4_9EURO|nr:hypothetical protein N7530_012510 [Penicillium desertorum]
MNTTPSTIPSNAYTGPLDGFGDYNVDRDLLKGITETVAVQCANRTGKKSVRILGFMNQRQSQQLPRQGQTSVIASWSSPIILQRLVSTVPIMI